MIKLQNPSGSRPHTIYLLIGATVMLAVLLIIKRPLQLVALISILLFFIVLLRVKVAAIFRSLTSIAPLLLLTFLVHGFLSSRQSVDFTNLFVFNITVVGVKTALFFTARLAVIVIVGTVLFHVRPPQHYGRQCGQIAGKSHFFGQIELIATLALRFVPFLENENQRLGLAMKARGILREGKLLHRLITLRTTLLAMILNSFRHAEHVAIALEARGYDPSTPRTHFAAESPSLSQGVITLIFVLLCISVLWI